MKSVFLLSFLLVIGSLANNSLDNSLNRSKIQDFFLDDRPFRMHKVNLLWEKAKKRLSGLKLADLYADLHVHDKHEAALKKYRLDDSDKDGLKEAEVRMGFREILEKYDLSDLFDIKGHLSNHLPVDVEKVISFSDKKLQTMWQRAEQAGFTKRDLKKLKEEFCHQQMKIDEMNFMKQEMEVADNELEHQKQVKKSANILKEHSQNMKVKEKDIRAGYYDLEAKFIEFEKEEPELRDVRVQQLWALAKKTDWSPEQLHSFKEELKHFEARLKKKDFYEDQVLQSAQVLKAGQGSEEKHQELEEKANNMGFKVKKLHSDLKTKLSKAFSQHTEL